MRVAEFFEACGMAAQALDVAEKLRSLALTGAALTASPLFPTPIRAASVRTGANQ